MRIPEALQAWASENQDHLSLDTRSELDMIWRALSDSVLAHALITDLSEDQLVIVDSLFETDRAERARLLLEVVSTWHDSQQNSDVPAPQTAAPSIAHADEIAGASSSERSSAVVQGTVFLSDGESGLDPLVGPPMHADTTSDSGAESDSGSDFYGPRSRRSTFSKTAAAAMVGIAVVSVLAAVALFVALTGGDTNDQSDTSGQEPVVTSTASPSSVQANTGDVTADTAPQPVEADSQNANEQAAVEADDPAAPTDPIETWWADTTTVLNSGSSQILASTYNVSPANRAVLIGHTAAITGIAISDDGRVLTSGADKRLVDWGVDVAAANPDVLEVDATLTALTRTKDQRLVAGDGLGNITVIDLANGGDPQIIPVHDVAVSTVAEVAPGTLAVGSVDGVVSVFPLDDPTAIRSLDHPVEVTGVSVTSNGLIATSSVDGLVRLWPQTAGEPTLISTHDTALTSLTPLTANRLASADITGTIHVVLAEAGSSETLSLTGHDGPVRAMLQLDEVTIASGGDDSTVRLWSLETGEQTRMLDGHGDLISALATLPDGRLVSTSADGTARVWDLTLPAEAPIQPPHTLNISDIAGWASDQLVTGGDDGRVMLVSTSTTTGPTLVTQHDAPIVGVEVMPNRDIVSLDALSTLRLTDADGDDGSLLSATIAPGATALAVRGSSGVVTGHADGTVRFTDFTAEIAVVNAHGSGINDIVTLSNGLILSAGQDRTVRVIDLDGDTERLPVFDLHTAPVDVVIELPDGRVASAGSDGIYIWSSSELGRDHVRLDGHRSQITGLHGLPGNRLLSTARDGRVRLWNLDDPQADPITLVDVPGVVNPVISQAGNGLFVVGAARGYVTFDFDG